MTTGTRRLRLFALVLAVLLVAASFAALSGCGKGDDKVTTTAPSSAADTTAVTTTKKAAPTTAATTQQPEEDDEDDYLDEDEAISNVRDQAGSSARVISSYKGFDYEGTKVWVITVEKADGKQATYYVGRYYCYSPDDEEEEEAQQPTQPQTDPGAFAGISETDAGQLAMATAGYGWTPISISQGSYGGSDAWQIDMVNDDGDTKTYYVNSGGCFAAD